MLVAALLQLLTHAGPFSVPQEAHSDALDPVQVQNLPPWTPPSVDPRTHDWLIDPEPWTASLNRGENPGELVLSNGLVRRVFRIENGAATIALDDLRSRASLLRAVQPEARLVINGIPLVVGGLLGQPDRAYLSPGFLAQMQPDPAALRLGGIAVGPIAERLQWKEVRHHAPHTSWPPPGLELRFDYALTEATCEALETQQHQLGASQSAPLSDTDIETLAGLKVSVHYELYDHAPLFSKWISITNNSSETIELDRVVIEQLAVVEESNQVETRAGVPIPPPESLHVESDYAMGGMTAENSRRFVVHWKTDPSFTSQVNWNLANPCLLEVGLERGPNVLLDPGQDFESMRAFELLQEPGDRERRGLARRKMTRILAPWVTENPLIMHVISSDPPVVRSAIDQASDCGFEMVSLSFGSGLNMEDDSPANLARFRDLAQYAETRGIQLGGYSLLSSRRIQPDGDNCINPDTGQPGGQTHGFCPALASGWGQTYLEHIRLFFGATGFLQFTHDGSYPGDYDAQSRPPLQRGLEDSQWVQWNQIRKLYQWQRSRGVFLRVPDYYYLVGASECGMGYREVNWSLPRAQQVIHTRQNIFDGTWNKTPSMGWMFVPLTQYHGGGAAATIEPLSQHIEHYRRMLLSNLGLGVQAVYRGQRLYDSKPVKEMVRGVVDWYLEHRDILESDVIHGRRADGRDLDWMLHAGPGLEECGLVVVYNPLAFDVTKELVFPLYYTGLSKSASVSINGAPLQRLALDDNCRLRLSLGVPAGGMTWIVLRK